MRERFPKLGLFFQYLFFLCLNFPRCSLSIAFFGQAVYDWHFYVYCSQSSRLPRSASGMGYWTMVPFHFYEHASMGKWSGFMLCLLAIFN